MRSSIIVNDVSPTAREPLIAEEKGLDDASPTDIGVKEEAKKVDDNLAGAVKPQRSLFQRIYNFDWKFLRFNLFCFVSMIAESLAMPLLLASFQGERLTGRQPQPGYFVTCWVSLLLLGAYAIRLFLDIQFGAVTSESLDETEKRPCSTISKIMLVGMLLGLEVLFYAYSADISRVPGLIQPALLQSLLIWNVILSKVILGVRYPIRQLIGLSFVLLGVITCLSPVALEEMSPGETGKLRRGYHWPCIFAMGCISAACANVVTEKIFQENRTFPVNLLLTIACTAQLCFIGIMFWIDLVPHFGESRNLEEFSSEFLDGATCLFSPDTSHAPERCDWALPFSLLYVLSQMFTYVYGYEIVRLSSGNYFASLQTFANCMAGFFWIAFPITNSWAGGAAYDRLDLTFALISVPPVIIGLAFVHTKWELSSPLAEDNLPKLPYDGNMLRIRRRAVARRGSFLQLIEDQSPIISAPVTPSSNSYPVENPEEEKLVGREP
ncbi:hypothetical protein AAMO2058_000224800 [Amorphochlora amoebiformis]